MSKLQNGINVKFDPAFIPERFTADANLEYASSLVKYHVLWQEEGTRYPLSEWIYEDKEMFSGTGPIGIENGAYLTDLDVKEAHGFVAVRSHGNEKGVAGVKDSMQTQSSWFLHFADNPGEIWVHSQFERRPDFLRWEIKKPHEALAVAGIGIHIQKENNCLSLGSEKGESFLFRLSSGDLSKICVDISIEAPENEQGYVDHREPVSIKLKVRNNSGFELKNANLKLFGFDSIVNRKIDLTVGERKTVELSVDLGEEREIIPIVAKLDHEDGSGLAFRTIWVPQVILETDQACLDGGYAENLRSTVHRYLFNVWREAEPRFTMYGNSAYARNVTSAVPAMYDQNKQWEWLKVWLLALRSCNYMPEHISLTPPPTRNEQWLFQNQVLANDGLGFVMFQWGKLYLRASDELRQKMIHSDLGDLLIMAKHMRRCVNYNGCIDDHSEVVDAFISVMTVGNPYAQSLCLCGVALIHRALKKAADSMLGDLDKVDELIGLYSKLKDLLKKGVDFILKEKGGFCDEIIDQGFVNPNTYSNLAPGMFLTDPDLGDDVLVEEKVLRTTIDFNKAYHMEGVPARILTCPFFQPYPGFSHNAYSQIAMIINQMAVGDERAAGLYLNELLTDSEDGAGRERHVSAKEDYVLDREFKEPDFYHYLLPEGRIGGKENAKLNPGNGVCVSYYLYMIDRMIGITPRGDKIEIRPELAGQKKWSVSEYPTRLGMLSYSINRSERKYQCEFSAEAPMDLFLPAPDCNCALLVDGIERSPDIRKERFGNRLFLALPEGEHRVDINLL